MVTKLLFVKSTKSVSGFGCFVQKSGNTLKTRNICVLKTLLKMLITHSKGEDDKMLCKHNVTKM